MNNADPASEDQLTVQTVNNKGKAPRLRIATPAAALTAYNTQHEIDRLRQVRFGALAGMYAGFPPTPPSTMQKMGLADMPNVNTKIFKSKIDSYASNWNAINSAGADWYEVEAEHENPMERKRRSLYLTECFNWAIKKWANIDFCSGNEYILQSATRDLQMAIFSIGIAYFADGIDFRFRCIPTRKILVPEGVKVTLENCPAIFIEDQMSVPDLYAMRNKSGWNEDAILSVLYLKTNMTSRTLSRQETYGEWVQRVRENDTWMYSDWPPLDFVHVYVKEFTDDINKGRISHGIFCDCMPFLAGTSELMSKNTDKEKEDITSGYQQWLYHKDDVAERWSQVMIAFTDSTGPEGTWHGAKGYGDLIYDMCRFGDQMFNATARSAILNNSLLFKSQSEADRQKLNQFTITPVGVLNPGLELEQIRIQTDISSAMGMFNLGNNLVNQVSRNFPQGETNNTGEQPTATQVNYERADEAQFTNQQVSNYRSTGLDPLGCEMYRRLAQPASKYPEAWPGGHIAKEFRKKCKEYGIPEADLLKVRVVRASRNVGTGNIGLDLMKADQLLQIATPGEGQMNARMNKAIAIAGPDMAPAYVVRDIPPPGFDDTTINQENLFIQNGQTPQAFGEQDHQKHLGVQMPWGHITLLQGLEELANQWMEQGIQGPLIQDAAELLRKIQAGIDHSNQHVEFMASMPKVGKQPAMFQEQVNELRKLLNDFTQFAETFAESIQSAQEKEQPTPEQMDPKMAETQAKIQRDNMLAQNKAEIARFQAEQRAQNTQITGAAKMEVSAAQHEQNLGQQAQQAQLDIETQTLQNAQDVEANAVKTGLDIMKSREEVERKRQEASTAETK